MKKYANAKPTARSSPGCARRSLRISANIGSTGPRGAGEMRAAGPRVFQHEDLPSIRMPVLEPGLARQEQRKLELDERLHRWREDPRAKGRERACHRPHAVRHGTVESEKLRAAIPEVDRVEVAREPAVAPSGCARHG